ncbi:unnamed protein product [Caenorhabditis angaria]|uniref:Meckelin n=1 Tax=Caenorhabditis angaria TaxID=860376 RepID=A0A9P1ICM6_9PELO|nr:unnamed protein product [Caenorhabditis angaria]
MIFQKKTGHVFTCQQCPNSTIPSKDRLECICSADQKLISKQLFISICESCPQGSFVSPDKLECIKCTKNETCQCSDQNILVYREQSGKIIENGALCESCSKGFRATDQGFCEKSDEECENCTSQSYSRIKLQNGDDMRSTFISKNLEIATKKCAERDMKYCELLVNLCVLQNFDSSSPINSCGILENIKRSYNPWQTFWDPVDFIDDSELDKDNVIDHQYIFDENSYIDIVFAKYDVDGTFEGYVDNSNLNLHFCGPDMFPKSAYLFGRRYSKSCQIRKELFNDIQIQRKFFEAFIRFEDETGRIKMYPIHVLNSAIRVNDQLVNTNDRNRWTGDQSASRDLTKSSETESVVVWRTYLIANEWNELQQYRKTSLSLQMILIIVIHEYFQYKNYALIEPSFEKYNEESSYTQSSILTRFSVVVFMYLFVAACQMLGKVIIVERMLTDPFHNFIDLCSVSNISVLSLTHRLYGYYIHGRSVHGKGDAGMSEMNAFLQRERDNLCGYRGLEPSSELQTFTLNLPIHFRENYDEICRITKQPTSGAIGHDAMTLKMNQTVEAHDKMNNFLKKFVDHSISDLDYVVRDRPLLEAVLDAEMTDTSQIGTFTRDPSEIAYSTCFVYGNEWCWTSFECLLTCVIFIWSDSIILAAFIVFITSKFLRLIFSYLSTAHLVKTSLIDQRFLV